jgi:Fe-Mn family superoxide dismutase
MMHALPDLPYGMDGLAPLLSGATLEHHWGKHHRTYVDALNRLVRGTGLGALGLEDLVRSSSGTVFNNAAQHFNHSLYWRSLSPQGGGEPKGTLGATIDRYYGSFSTFRTAFAEQASSELVMATLNRYFDSVGAAIAKEGGEILKFMGDGILATFAQPDANVCEQALRAARTAVRDVAALATGSGEAAGNLDLGIALHKGEVLYGNVGTPERLDFTMIGPAVNEAARMEKLTKSLGCAILASDSFQAALGESRRLLQPAGVHAISGLSAPRALYVVVLDDKAAA